MVRLTEPCSLLLLGDKNYLDVFVIVGRQKGVRRDMTEWDFQRCFKTRMGKETLSRPRFGMDIRN